MNAECPFFLERVGVFNGGFASRRGCLQLRGEPAPKPAGRRGESGPASRPLWARAEEKVCRLALIHACSARREGPAVDEAAARWACRLSEHLTRRTLALAGRWVADNRFDARQKGVLRVVRDAGARSATRSCTPGRGR
jgi:hypothetical protein